MRVIRSRSVGGTAQRGHPRSRTRRAGSRLVGRGNELAALKVAAGFKGGPVRCISFAPMSIFDLKADPINGSIRMTADGAVLSLQRELRLGEMPSGERRQVPGPEARELVEHCYPYATALPEPVAAE